MTDETQLQELIKQNQELTHQLRGLSKHLIQTIIRLDENIPLNRMDQFTEILKKPLAIDDRGTLAALKRFEEEVQKVQEMDIGQISNELKFIGQKIHQIDQRIQSIEKNGVPTRLEVSVAMNGKQMIKKPNRSDSLDEWDNDEEDKYLNELMMLLDDRECKIVTLRLGLDNQGERTYTEISKHFNISAARVRDIYLRAMWIWKKEKNNPTLVRIKDQRIRKAAGLPS